MAEDNRLVVFISSSMEELKPERKAVRSAIKANPMFDPFAWEWDATAYEHSAQEEWRHQLARSNITIVLLWKKVGKWTKDEIDISLENGIPTLVFIKQDETNTLRETEGDFLSALEDAETPLTPKYFKSSKKLKKYIDSGLRALLQKRFTAPRDRDLSGRSDVRGVRRVGSTADHGITVEEAAGPTIRARAPAEVGHLARNRTFVGRAAEKGKLMRAIGAGDQLVAVIGPPGIGKKAILKDLTVNGDFGPGFKDGAAIHPADVDTGNLEDLLQAIWEEFYETDDPSVVEPRKRDRQLSGKETLIFLPDVAFTSDQVEQLLDEMPQAVFCVTAAALRVPGKQILLSGFTDPEEMLEAFEGRYHASVPAEARGDIASLCGLLDGSPSLIGLLADRAWGDAEYVPEEDDEHPLPAWASAHHEMTAAELRDWLVPPDEQKVVSITQATAVHTPRTVMIDVAGSEESVDDALADNLIEAASPRYRINGALAEATATEDSTLMGEIFASSLNWAANAGPSEIYADRAFVLRMLEWGATQARWNDVLRLGMATQASMALGGRHGAWAQVLGHCRIAARLMEPRNEAAEAWALHQLGSRSLLRDDLAHARVLLHESLRRQPDRDGKTAEVTRRNLGLVPAAIVTGGVLLLWLVFLVTWTPALARGAAVFNVNLSVEFDEVVSAPVAIPVVRFTDPFQASSEKPVRVTIAIESQNPDGNSLSSGASAFCIAEDRVCVSGAATSGRSSPSAQGPSGFRAAPVTGQPIALAAVGEPRCEIRVIDGTHVEANIPGGEGCVLEIGFQPLVAGEHEATLSLRTADDGSEFTGTLVGEASPTPTAISEIEPEIQSFANSGDMKPFRVENVGTASFTIGPIEPPPGFDVGEDDCSDPDTPLEPGEGCDFTVEFRGEGQSGLLELDLTSEDGPVLGDNAVVLLVDNP